MPRLSFGPITLWTGHDVIRVRENVVYFACLTLLIEHQTRLTVVRPSVLLLLNEQYTDKGIPTLTTRREHTS